MLDYAIARCQKSQEVCCELSTYEEVGGLFRDVKCILPVDQGRIRVNRVAAVAVYVLLPKNVLRLQVTSYDASQQSKIYCASSPTSSCTKRHVIVHGS